MKKIVIFSLESINNAGDEILGTTTQYIVEQSHCLVKRAELMPNDRQVKNHIGCMKYMLVRLLQKINGRIFKSKMYGFTNFLYNLRNNSYYLNEMEGADGIILAIGMLKYKTQDFSYFFEMINNIAKRKKIPVLMSAMSIASKDKNDWRFYQVVRAINNPAVKMITTRDGKYGIDALKRDYNLNSKIVVDYVGDPALWIPQCYGIKKQSTNKIGIGLVRKSIYHDYGHDITDEQLLEFYIRLIQRLEQSEDEWVLFCNGIDADYLLGIELLNQLGLGKDKLLKKPENAETLINDISNFRVIFGARLHACITAVSLGIPVVGLLWDEKLKYFSKTMKIEKYFIPDNKLCGDLAYNLINSAKNEHIDKVNVNNYKHRYLDSISQFIKVL